MEKKIMTVDDSTSMRQMVAFTLARAGFDVMEAKDGTDALSKLNGVKVQMMFVDLNMPNMNGFEFIRAVRANPAYRFIPIIMLTTVTARAEKLEGKRAGATGWIEKPFAPEQLLSVVKRVLP